MSIGREEYKPGTGQPTGYDGSECWPERFWPEDCTATEPGFEEHNINNEKVRVYTYEAHSIEIWDPIRLFISASGSHRVQDAEGLCHYIPPGWQLLSWDPKDFHDPVQF